MSFIGNFKFSVKKESLQSFALHAFFSFDAILYDLAGIRITIKYQPFMNMGEDIQSLRKITEFTRLISIFIVSMHFYICCYLAFKQWGWTAEITDRIIQNISNTGLFNGLLRPKLAALLFLFIALFGVNGKKEEKIHMKTILAYLIAGLLFYFISILCFYLNAKPSIIAIAYIGTTSLGYILILMGGGLLSRVIKDKLKKDIFNEENETFPQEERILENEFSINLPAKYKLRNKIRDSWINIINPFRGILITLKLMPKPAHLRGNSGRAVGSYGSYSKVGGEEAGIRDALL